MEFFQFIERMGMVIEMGMIMTKDAYGAPPDLSENMFSKCEFKEESESIYENWHYIICESV